MLKRLVTLALLLVFLAAACSPQSSEPEAGSAGEPDITVYRSPT